MVAAVGYIKERTGKRADKGIEDLYHTHCGHRQEAYLSGSARKPHICSDIVGKKIQHKSRSNIE